MCSRLILLSASSALFIYVFIPKTMTYVNTLSAYIRDPWFAL